MTTAVSLIAALTLPLAAGAQKEWLASLSPTAQLFLGNGVVIAITLGIRAERGAAGGAQGLLWRPKTMKRIPVVLALALAAWPSLRSP